MPKRRVLPTKTGSIAAGRGPASGPRRKKPVYEITVVYMDPDWEEVELASGKTVAIPDNNQIVVILHEQAGEELRRHIQFIDAEEHAADLPDEVDKVPIMYNRLTKTWSAAGEETVVDFHAWLKEKGVYVDLRAILYGQGKDAKHQPMSAAYVAQEEEHRRGRALAREEDAVEAPPRSPPPAVEGVVDRRRGPPRRRPQDRGGRQAGAGVAEEPLHRRLEPSDSEGEEVDPRMTEVDVHGKRRGRRVPKRAPGQIKGEKVEAHQSARLGGAAGKVRSGGYAAKRSGGLAAGAHVATTPGSNVRIKGVVDTSGQIERPRANRSRRSGDGPPPDRGAALGITDDAAVVGVDEDEETAAIKARMEERQAQWEKARGGSGGVEESKADPGSDGDESYDEDEDASYDEDE